MESFGSIMVGLTLMAFVIFITRSLQTGSNHSPSVLNVLNRLILYIWPDQNPSIPTNYFFHSWILHFHHSSSNCLAISFIVQISFCTYLVDLMVLYQYLHEVLWFVLHDCQNIHDLYWSSTNYYMLRDGADDVCEVPFGNMVKLLTMSVQGAGKKRNNSSLIQA